MSGTRWLLQTMRTCAARRHEDPGLRRPVDPVEPLPQVSLVLNHGSYQAMEPGHREGRGQNVPNFLHPSHRQQDQPRDQKATQVVENPGPLAVHAQER